MEMKDSNKKTISDMTSDICTGCSSCINTCPVHCIDMEPDGHGFLVPHIDYNKCLNCGLCESRCPVLHIVASPMHRKVPKVMASYSLDPETRFTSTSGGIFSELANYVIEQGGYVVGALYDKEHKVIHTIAKTKEDVGLLKQSKYSQSDKGFIFTKIRDLLAQNITVLFVGTPCEVAGLLSFLDGRPDNLILLDFICLGVNSPLVYNNYLNYLEKKYRSQIKRVWFKYKGYSWERFSTRVDFKNGKTYMKDRYDDLFMRGYIYKNLYIRPSCTHCAYKEIPRNSDITLGDFWGIDKQMPEVDRGHGVSVVMLNSPRGDNLLAAIKDRLFTQESTVEAVLNSNPRLLASARLDDNTDAFYDCIKSRGFKKAVQYYTKESLLIKLKRKIRLKLKGLGR